MDKTVAVLDAVRDTCRETGRPAWIVRWFARIERQEDTGCLVWMGHRDPDGYGVVYVGRTPLRAHRVAGALRHGRPVPDGAVVRHTCDNPPCVTGDHLATGTVADNVADRVARGRSHKGAGVCHLGHPMDGRTKRGAYCKTCARARRLRNYYAGKAAAQ